MQEKPESSFGKEQVPRTLFSKLHLALIKQPLASNEKTRTPSQSDEEDLGFAVVGDTNTTPSNDPKTSFEYKNVTVCYHDFTERTKPPNEVKQYSNPQEIFYIACQADFHSLADFFLPLLLPLPLPWIKALHNTLFELEDASIYELENTSILKRKHFVACHVDKRNNEEKVTLYDPKHYLGFNTQATWAIIDAAFGLKTERNLLQRTAHHLPTVLSYLSLAGVIALNTVPYLQVWEKAHHTGLMALLHHSHWSQIVLVSYLAYAAGHIVGYLLGRLAHRLAYTTDRARETYLGIQPLIDDIHCGQCTVNIIQTLSEQKNPAEIKESIQDIVSSYDGISAESRQSSP